ncbi:hypothetical protein LRAMOSA00550 [Lichtheimia ramosa]|uniref:J domain-containing protein n=1 Tax=Lichtheimia ramosa TaxID=688394 RepID=A0A077WAK5_9FUNG|nr:hypothetical protein LRAMOSA00550 [Lichtheimia ramosa]
MANVPDYYSILEVSPTATQEEIREAYKKQALLHHPDRLKDNASPEERKEATKKFQLIADAYYILGDRERRATYDRSHRRYSPTSGDPQSDANRVFGDVFEELLRVEVEHPSYAWRILGTGAGAILGFIIGNVAGAAVGAMAGRTLGKIRDHKGVSVYTAFQRLSVNERRDILSTLLTRFLTQGAAGVMK